jgi:uncharacterized protein (TIGR00255 family)
LEITCKFPNSIIFFEDKVKLALQKHIKRGKVYYNLIYEGTSPHADSLFIDKQLAKNYYHKLSYLGKMFNIKDNINMHDLISIPGILGYKTTESDVSKLWPAVDSATKLAIGKLIADREKEGRAIYSDLKKRLKKIQRYVDMIKDKANANVDGYKKKLEERIKEISGNNKLINNDRLEMEVAIYAKNSDISEEINRLKSHIKNFHKTIEGDGETGKKLDFIAQELHREVNTIGSKSNDYTISKAAIEIKSEIEKIREQVKNLE